MADNVEITAGSGTTVAADDISSVWFQRVKIAVGADGAHDGDLDYGQAAAAASIPVVLASDTDFVKAEDAAHSSGDKGIAALAVRQDTAAALAGTAGDYTPLGVDALNNLRVITAMTATTVTATFNRPADTAVYAAGDMISDSTSAPTSFTIAAARVNGGAVTILSATLTSSAAQSTKLDAELWLFPATYTSGNDNAANAFADAEVATARVVPFGNGPIIAAAGSVIYHAQVNKNLVAGAATTNLFWALVARNAYTPTSAETFTLTLDVIQW